MKKIFLLVFLLLSQITISQKLEKVSVHETDSNRLYINDGIATELYYYKMVPKNKIVGVLTILPSGGETIENLLKQITLHSAAVKKGFLIIIPSINWGTENRLPEIAFLDTVFKQIVEKHNVPKDKFILCGLSNGGMISLRYAINSVKDKNTFIIPKGIIGLDPPLDFVHFYNYCEREIKRNFNEAGVAEANWLLNNYNTIYGGSPKEFPQNYIEASLFSYGEEKGGNAKYLTNIGIRMLSDLNIDYLINKRKRDLYDWNGADIVAFVNQLKINGNKNAEVIISQNKGTRLDGSIHPHSWSIMNTESTLNWMIKLVE